MQQKYIVTSALRYAEGPIHLGHLAGAYLPADVYVRYLRTNGDDVVFISGTDEHGVPITLKAEKEGLTPKQLVDKYHKIIHDSFERMGIHYDNFSGTTRPVHYELSKQFFLDLNKNGFISNKEEEQFYDEKRGRYLPDRYIEGKCPHCGFERARGDQCDKCGRLLSPTDLVEPKSVLSGSVPVIRSTRHWYLKLQDFETKLLDWLKTKENWKDNVRNFVVGWISKEGLKERAITRDINWGVPVPLEEAKDKVLYVWFDAPIGYISSTIEWAEKQGKPSLWKEYWQDKNTRLVHFIGKDNIPFHAIIWPAMLMGQDQPFVLPYDVPANEYLTLEGEKFSTSQEWAVWMDEYLEVFPPDPLRYFLSANAPETKDADFSWKAFQSRNNDELANILGNFANRTLTFLHNQMGGVIPETEYGAEEKAVLAEIQAKLDDMTQHFAAFKLREASKLMMDLPRIGNKFFDETKPWVLKKENPEKLARVMKLCVHLLRVIAVAMNPILPFSAEKLWKMLAETGNINDERWDTLVSKVPQGGRKLNPTEILFVKYEDDVIEAQIKKLVTKSKKAGEKTMETPEVKAPSKITIDEFKKFDLRVAEVLEATPLEKSNKLLKLKVKVGDTEKQILAGIKQFYSAESMIGKKIIIVNNLEPAKLMGETSEGMLLAASTDDKSKVILLAPESDIDSGSKVG